MHKPIQIKNLCLSFPAKICFEDFSVEIPFGSRIAIIGRNGTGKTTLLNMLYGTVAPTSGDIRCASDTVCGFVPQIIDAFDSLSGGQRFNAALTQALSSNPDVLLLDEPTNHLDRNNRKSLIRMLQGYMGTLIIVTHDTELLRRCVDTLWHIDNGQIHIFTGNYDDYMATMQSKRFSIEQELSRLAQQKKEMHHALMKEQKRAHKSRIKGEKSIHQRKWPTIVSDAKARRGEETSGRKKAAIDQKKQALTEQLANLRLPEIIVPKFSLAANSVGDRTIVAISDGSIGYSDKNPLVQRINLSICGGERIAIYGNNASGKSTLIKAILDDKRVIKSGRWTVPKRIDMGYLDQHYNTLSAEKTVYETIAEIVPTWPMVEVRRHLNDFLFRKNEEINNKAAELSGGERVRLTLAQIAACTPKLLILDEITNNIDLETRQHVVEVLKNYPGALLVISHETEFLREIGIEDGYQIAAGAFSRIENL